MTEEGRQGGGREIKVTEVDGVTGRVAVSAGEMLKNETVEAAGRDSMVGRDRGGRERERERMETVGDRKRQIFTRDGKIDIE